MSILDLGRRSGVTTALAWVCLTGAGCAPSGGESGEVVSSVESPIINGSADTTHPAAVAYLAGGGKCTATIIAVDGNDGYALTAAHCIGGSNGVIRQGTNHNNSNSYVEYPVVERVVHPGYNTKGPLLDFAMLRFTGASANPPQVMPAMSPAEDGLALGQTVTLVGYGQTEFGGTATRRSIDRQIGELTSLRLMFDQTTGGQCFGDSGGPAVRATGGGDRVAGVASTVSDANPVCTGIGTSARVSAVYDTFILPMMNDTAFLPLSCAECYEAVTYLGSCYGQVENCFENADCSAYVDCINSCPTIGCQNQCATTHPSGAALYDGISACACDSQCVTECQGDALCADPVMSCGLSFSDADCNACIKSDCCAESAACAGDPTCSSCFPNCEPGASADALSACLETSCSSTCEFLLPGEGGAGGGGTGGQPGAGGAGVTGTGTGTATGTPISGDGDDPDDEGGCSIAAPSRSGSSAPPLGALLFGAAIGLLEVRRRRLNRPQSQG